MYNEAYKIMFDTVLGGRYILVVYNKSCIHPIETVSITALHSVMFAPIRRSHQCIQSLGDLFSLEMNVCAWSFCKYAGCT